MYFDFQGTEYDLLVEEEQIGFVMAEEIPGTKLPKVPGYC